MEKAIDIKLKLLMAASLSLGKNIIVFDEEAIRSAKREFGNLFDFKGGNAI